MKIKLKIQKIIIVTTLMLLPFQFVMAMPVAPLPPAPPSVLANEPEEPAPPKPPISITQEVPKESQPQSEPTASSQVSSEKVTGNQIALENSEAGGFGVSDISGNSETGSSSENVTLKENSDESKIANSNDANVSNIVEANSSSGGNNSNYNTGNGSVESGDSNFVMNLVNMVNTNIIALPGGIVIFILKNIISDLIGDYIIDPNTNEAYDLNGSRVEVSNKDTGASSSNTANVNSKYNFNVINDNNAKVENNLNLISNTGGNSASYNTGNGNIITGDSNLSLNILNFLNSNFVLTGAGIFGVINIFGNWAGNIILPKILGETNADISGVIKVKNLNTGSGSSNNAQVINTENIDVNNDNVSEITNNIKVDSNSGENDASYNTGNASVSTGESTAFVNLQNDGNKNIVGEMIFYLAVNVLGSWNGSILLPSLFFNLPSNEGSSNALVSNENTGANSENSAQLSTVNNAEVTNDNKAEIENNIILNSNTGGNSASYNTGNAQIKTGNAKALLNILNLFNLNVFATNALYLIVNVFGNWTGNISVSGTNDTESTTITNSEEKLTEKVVEINNQKYKVTNDITKSGQKVKVTIVNDIGENSEPIVLGVENNNKSGSAPAATTNNSLKKYLGNIFLVLFVVYAAVLIVLAKRKKRNIFTIRRLA